MWEGFSQQLLGRLSPSLHSAEAAIHFTLEVMSIPALLSGQSAAPAILSFSNFSKDLKVSTEAFGDLKPMPHYMPETSFTKGKQSN